MSALNTVATDQRRWSLTANNLKKTIGRSRIATGVLAITGALLATLGAQLAPSIPSRIAGYGGAAAIALTAVIRQKYLVKERLEAWIMARAAAESFKREMYQYRTSTGRYSGDDRDIVLIQSRDAILAKVRAAQNYAVEPLMSEIRTPEPLDANGYIAERPVKQIEWFRERARQYSTVQKWFGTGQFWLAVLGAVLAAISASGKGFGVWIGVITTAAGALSAHVLAQRYEQLMVSYRAAAERLESILERWRAGDAPLSALVEQCEAVLAEENQGWVAGADNTAKSEDRDSATPGKNAVRTR